MAFLRAVLLTEENQTSRCCGKMYSLSPLQRQGSQLTGIAGHVQRVQAALLKPNDLGGGDLGLSSSKWFDGIGRLDLVDGLVERSPLFPAGYERSS